MTRTVPDHQLSNETTANSASRAMVAMLEHGGARRELVALSDNEVDPTIEWRQSLLLPTPERVPLDSQVEAA